MKITRQLVLVMLIGTFMAGCASVSADEAFVDDQEPPLVAMQSEPETTPDSPESPSMGALPAEPPANHCLECHSNAERLQQLAEEEEVAPSLSEGSG